MNERNDNWKDTERAETAQHGHTNPDPITGAPGSHPAGTGLGAAVGGASAALAGAAIGAAISGPAAPIGGVIGAVVGSVVGGLAGKGVAESANPTEQDAYWRENYKSRPYVQPGRDYEDYRPAYEHGWKSREQFAGKSFDEAEPDLQSQWEQSGNSSLSWDTARHATRDAWDRLDRPDYSAASSTPGTEASADDTAEESYWRSNYSTRPYFSSAMSYDDDFLPAYRYGWQSQRRLSGRRFEDAEPDLRSGWEHFKGKSRLTWEKAKDAVRDSWDRMTGSAGTASTTGYGSTASTGGMSGSSGGAASYGTSATSAPTAAAGGSHRTQIYSGTSGSGTSGVSSGDMSGSSGVACNTGYRDTTAGPTGFDADYWQRNFTSRPYYTPGSSYADYEPGYRYGHEARDRYRGRRFEDVEPDLRSGWEKTQYNAKVGWEKAKNAVRDAFSSDDRR